jgi:hypothetical protein
LQENLRSAQGERLPDFFVHLIEGDDIGAGVVFRAVKGAEFAIDVAHIGIIDIAINDVGDDLVAAAVVGLGAGQLAAAIGQRPQLLEGQAIKPQRLSRADAPAGPGLFQQRFQ